MDRTEWKQRKQLSVSERVIINVLIFFHTNINVLIIP